MELIVVPPCYEIHATQEAITVLIVTGDAVHAIRS
jgi:hypothetical protein